MTGLVILAVIAVPAALCWLILRARHVSDSPEEEYAGPHDAAPLTPVPLREYTPTGEIDVANPPAGYTLEEPPID